MNTHPTVELSPHSAEALPMLVRMLETALNQHIADEGPPPGEYEQGVADGIAMALMILKAAAKNCSRP